MLRHRQVGIDQPTTIKDDGDTVMLVMTMTWLSLIVQTQVVLAITHCPKTSLIIPFG